MFVADPHRCARPVFLLAHYPSRSLCNARAILAAIAQQAQCVGLCYTVAMRFTGNEKDTLPPLQRDVLEARGTHVFGDVATRHHDENVDRTQQRRIRGESVVNDIDVGEEGLVFAFFASSLESK